MKFLTDENIAVSVVKFLRSKNHDVKDVKEDQLFGTSDFKLLGIAISEQRTIIPHDKDFANISRNRSIGHKGIILIRLLIQSPKTVIEKLDDLFKTEKEERIRTSVITIRDYYTEIDKNNSQP